MKTWQLLSYLQKDICTTNYGRLSRCWREVGIMWLSGTCWWYCYSTWLQTARHHPPTKISSHCEVVPPCRKSFKVTNYSMSKVSVVTEETLVNTEWSQLGLYFTGIINEDSLSVKTVFCYVFWDPCDLFVKLNVSRQITAHWCKIPKSWHVYVKFRKATKCYSEMKYIIHCRKVQYVCLGRS